MIALNLINDAIIPLRTTDNGYLGMQMMDEYKVEHLPITDQSEYLGIISELDLLNSNDPEMAIENHVLSEGKLFVYEDQPIHDVIELASEHNLTIIPVVSRKNQYLGAITLKSLIQSFTQFISPQIKGSIIVIEVNGNDYSLAQIAQIIEYNDAKILNIYTLANPDSTKINIVIKVNKQDIGAIIQTFNRYNYIIKEHFAKEQSYDELHDKYDEFMTWLNV